MAVPNAVDKQRHIVQTQGLFLPVTLSNDITLSRHTE
jgi:hypothetical protein